MDNVHARSFLLEFTYANIRSVTERDGHDLPPFHSLCAKKSCFSPAALHRPDNEQHVTKYKILLLARSASGELQSPSRGVSQVS